MHARLHWHLFLSTSLFIMIFPRVLLMQQIHASCSPEILRNKLAGIVKLNDFTASLKWSKIGNLHMRLVQVLSCIY